MPSQVAKVSTSTPLQCLLVDIQFSVVPIFSGLRKIKGENAMIVPSKSCSYISVASAMLCSAPGLELRLNMTLVSMLISRVNSRHDFEHDLRVSSRVEFRGELRGETSCLESHTCVYSSSETIYPNVIRLQNSINSSHLYSLQIRLRMMISNGFFINVTYEPISVNPQVILSKFWTQSRTRWRGRSRGPSSYNHVYRGAMTMS